MRDASGRFGRLGAGLLLAILGLGLAQTTPIAPLDEETFWRSFSSVSSQVGQIRWHYVTGGSGDVVVLLHGWPQTWFEWRDVMPHLAKRYRVVAVELPGLGDSTGSESYDKRTLAQHLQETAR